MIADLPDLASVTIVGVVSRGAMLALRLRDLIEAQTGVRPPCAALDVYGGDDRASSDRRRGRELRRRRPHDRPGRRRDQQRMDGAARDDRRCGSAAVRPRSSWRC